MLTGEKCTEIKMWKFWYKWIKKFLLKNMIGDINILILGFRKCDFLGKMVLLKKNIEKVKNVGLIILIKMWMSGLQNYINVKWLSKPEEKKFCIKMYKLHNEFLSGIENCKILDAENCDNAYDIFEWRLFAFFISVLKMQKKLPSAWNSLKQGFFVHTSETKKLAPISLTFCHLCGNI